MGLNLLEKSSTQKTRNLFLIDYTKSNFVIQQFTDPIYKKTSPNRDF
jgi:hypothetical protein